MGAARAIGIDAGKIDANVSTTQLRELILDYGKSHEEDFIAEDSKFKGVNGQPGYPFATRKSRQRESIQIRRKIYQETILKGIFSPDVDYSVFVGYHHYMNARHVLPLVVRMWELPMLVLYSSIPAKGAPRKCKKFVTDIYTYKSEDQCVYFDRKDGVVEFTDQLCMVFYDDMVHFEVWKSNK